MSAILPPVPDFSKPPQLSCGEALRLIETLIEEGELKNVEHSFLFSHLRQCPGCKAELEQQRQMERRLRKSFAVIDTHPDFTKKLLKQLPEPEPVIEAPRKGRRASRSGSTKRMPAVRRTDGNWISGKLGPVLQGPPVDLGKERNGGLLVTASGKKMLAVMVLLLTFTTGLVAWYAFGKRSSSSPSVLYLAKMDGAADQQLTNQALKLEAGTVLAPGTVVSTQEKKGVMMRLESNGIWLASLYIGPHSRLKVLARQSFYLDSGEALFWVNKDRPKNEGEKFSVGTRLGTVNAVGTVFMVGVPEDRSKPVWVGVSEGRVSLISAVKNAEQALDVGKENDLPASGQFDPARMLRGERLAFLQRSDLESSRFPGLQELQTSQVAEVKSTPAAQADPVKAPDTTDVPEAAPPRHAEALNWNALVMNLDFNGQSLAKALDRLSEQFNSAPELESLARKAERLSGKDRVLTLTIQAPIPLKTLIRWLARDAGLRLDPLTGLRAAEPGEALGPSESGVLIEGSFKKDWDTDGHGAGRLPMEYPAYLLRAVNALNLNLWMEEGARTKLTALPVDEEATSRSPLNVLERDLPRVGLDWAVYDGLIVVARPITVERLTYTPRVLPIEELAGSENAPDAVRSSCREQTLKLLEGIYLLKNGEFGWYPRTENPPNGRWLLEEIRRQGPALHYNSGSSDHNSLKRLMELLRRGSSNVPSVVPLSEDIRIKDTINDWPDLEKHARGKIPISLPAREGAFPNKSFVARNLPLTQVVEWAARLHGMGVKATTNGLILDTPAACYGPASVQAINVSALAERLSAQRDVWPRLLEAHIRAWYPELFQGTVWFELRDRLVFIGDRRQLAAAQKVERALLDALKSAREPGTFDLEHWKAPWRLELDAQLAEPFKGAADEIFLDLSFQSLLRNFTNPLKTSVLVDPATMKIRAAQPLERFTIDGLTRGQALEKLAEKAGLRMVLEDGVIWLRDVK